MPCHNPIEYIDNSALLEEFCRALGQAEWIGLDTEFIRERTYYPQFCLLQVAMEDRVACIDLLALPTLDPLKTVLQDHRITKIFHSGRQDLELFHLLWGTLPVNVFDTQIAAALAGGPEQMGYGRLVEQLFKVTLAKEHTRTDWSQRPLSAAQLSYAADDVAYLGAACMHLRQRLGEMDRIAWAIEDSSALLDSSLYSSPPDQAWRKVAGIHHIPPTQRRSAQKLAAWRETKAQQLNLPRGWVCKDDVLLQLTTQNPAGALFPPIRGLDKFNQERCAHELRHLLKDIPPPETDVLSAPAHPPQRDAESKILLKKLTGVVQTKARKLDITPSVLASRRDLEMLLEKPTESRILKGWRFSIIGQEIIEFLPSVASTRHDC